MESAPDAKQHGPGPLRLWASFVPPSPNGCRCAPPDSLAARLQAYWELGADNPQNNQGFDATFVSQQAGAYTVTLHAVDSFGNQYETSTKVQVR